MGYGEDLILIVDDSPTILAALKNILSEQGLDCVEAHNGVEGLELMRNNFNVSLVVSDVQMPEMDGLDMLEEARSSGFTKPVIMLTTESERDLVHRGLKLKVSGWIIKPFKDSDLVKAIHSALRRKAA